MLGTGYASWKVGKGERLGIAVWKINGQEVSRIQDETCRREVAEGTLQVSESSEPGNSQSFQTREPGCL